MGRVAGPPIALVVVATEELDVRAGLIAMKMQLFPALRTYQEAGEHIDLAGVGLALTGLSAFLLNLFPHGTLNDGCMHVFEYDPIFAVIPYTPFQLVGLGVSLEVENISTILLRVENADS